ncbi:MAG: hypothetical protein ACK5NT_11455 [Pyrinomonadaceae bacterium]
MRDALETIVFFGIPLSMFFALIAKIAFERSLIISGLLCVIGEVMEVTECWSDSAFHVDKIGKFYAFYLAIFILFLCVVLAGKVFRMNLNRMFAVPLLLALLVFYFSSATIVLESGWQKESLHKKSGVTIHE